MLSSIISRCSVSCRGRQGMFFLQCGLHVQRAVYLCFCPIKFLICGVVAAVTRELKKLRRQLQGKRLIKTELCVKLSLLRLFHVDHVVQNRRSALSLACHEWFSCKGKEGKIYCCELPLSSKPQI